MRKQLHFWITLFCGVLIFTQCQKDTLVTDVPHNQVPDFNWGKGDSIPIVAPFYFVGKIDSQLYTLQDSISGYLNYVFDTAITECPGDTNMVFYAQNTGFYTLEGIQSLSINFLTCVDTTAATGIDSTVLDSLLGGRGTFHYGSSDKFNPIDGVEVSWIDLNGKVWKTRPGSGANDNNSFHILTVVPDTSYSTLGMHKITGTMSVTLHNGLDNIRIENGMFEMQYGVY